MNNKTKYSIKRWKSSKEYEDKVPSETSQISNRTNVDLLIAAENTKILNDEIFHFEIFETVSGKTYFHSDEMFGN